MKVVLDTNILVSAFVFGGEALNYFNRLLQDESIELLISPPIQTELEDVLFRDKFRRFQTRAYLNAQLNAYLKTVKVVLIHQQFQDCRDPKDNPFLDCAVNGQADYLLTGDPDLLALNPFHGVKIVTLRDFFQF